MLKQKQIQHLYHRAGFGLEVQDLDKALKKDPVDLALKLMKDSRHYRDLSVKESKTLTKEEWMSLTQEEKQALKMADRGNLRQLNFAWINRMANTKAQLREKMTLFWHGHFATRLPLAAFMQDQNNTIRKYALGTFGELLTAVSKDPAMLQFLNNQQNKKAHPNENFAREVLELFTLGRGNYTEKDIREAARAFTGWGFNFNREFVFRRRHHDFGNKTFLGRTGAFGGEDILKIILEEKQTARFITRKIYRYFVNPVPDEDQIEEWASHFYESAYDIEALMERIFSSDHFFEERHLGSRIKSPIEYIVGMMRMLNLRLKDIRTAVLIQKVLGQMLFFPPGVNGWPEGHAWIDSSTLMARLQIPAALIFSADFRFRAKAEFDAAEIEETRETRKSARRLQAISDWKPFFNYVDDVSDEGQVRKMRAFLLQKEPEHLDHSLLTSFTLGEKQQTRIKTLCMRLLCTPEFQFC